MPQHSLACLVASMQASTKTPVGGALTGATAGGGLALGSAFGWGEGGLGEPAAVEMLPGGSAAAGDGDSGTLAGDLATGIGWSEPGAGLGVEIDGEGRG